MMTVVFKIGRRYYAGMDSLERAIMVTHLSNALLFRRRTVDFNNTVAWMLRNGKKAKVVRVAEVE